VRLAVAFLDYYNRKFGKHCGPFTPAAVEALSRHPWPGNVRELKHCMERTVALHPGGLIDAVHLNLSPDAPAAPASDAAPTLGYQDARAQFEREYLKGVLEAARGNVSEAARISGIPRQNLYVRAKRWGFVIES
jgi:DNA-binding NtrC family response regulator